jgi:anthraniloyl-CoA monooxygenase
LDLAVDGAPGEAHQQKMQERTLCDLGSAGIVLAESCAISKESRITPGSCGLYCAEHVAAWRRIIDCLHVEGALVGASLVHAGRRGSTRPRGEGLDRPLREGNWPLLAASALSYAPYSSVPQEMTQEEIARATQDFVAAARFAEQAGFDILLLHCAHGYLLSGFLSPLSNQRNDSYGGSLENRMRFPLEVFKAIRAVWPKARPLVAAIPGSDFAKGGWQPEDAVVLAQALKDRACDAVAVLTAQSAYEAEPVYGPAFLNAISDLVRNQVRLPVIVGGYIANADLANTTLLAGRADLCIIDRVP